MSNYHRLFKLGRPPGKRSQQVVLWANLDGQVRTVDEDGTDAAVAGAGSLPDPTSEGDVLTVVEGEWAGEAPSGGSQTVTRMTPRVVTALELSTLDSTPIELVPTPGPGFVLIPLNVYWFYYAGETQNDVDGTLNIDWDGTTYQLVSVLAALFRANDRISTGTASAEARKTLITAEDKALVLTLDVPVVSGDGSGVIVMDYTTVPVTAA